MSPFRMARDLRDLYRGFVELLVIEETNEDASYEIAVSAQAFSRNTQEAVDDKLNFSATLMRAGEVEAANRLLKEFHDEVREEEVALIERVNEVKAAEAVRKEGMTRVRMARMLAVAMIGSSLLSFSAAGMALAGLVKDRAAELDDAQAAIRRSTQDGVLGTRLAAATGQERLHRVNIGRLKLMLSMSELRTIRELTGGQVDESGLAGIIGLLPDRLAEKVQEAIVIAADLVERAAETVKVAELPDNLKAERRKARRAAAKAEAEEHPTPESSQADDDDSRPDDDDDGLGPDDDEDRAAEEDDDEGRQRDDEDGGLPPIFHGDE